MIDLEHLPQTEVRRAAGARTAGRTVPVAAAVLATVAATALATTQGPVAAALLGIAVVTLPGVFVARHAAPLGPAAVVALVVSTSITAWMLVAHLLLSFEWWRPRAAALTALAVCALAGAVMAARRGGQGLGHGTLRGLLHRPDRVSVGRCTVLVLALALWWWSLGSIDVAGVGHWGLVTQFPAAWFAALVLAGGVAAAAAIDRRGSVVVFPAALGTVIVVLYATLPMLVPTARYPWAYKHIGVIRLLSDTGHLQPQLDIYHAFSGFFGLGALVLGSTGIDPTSYAPWAQVAAEAAAVTAVIALVGVISRSRRAGRVAGVFYVLTNWVGQNYFAPQALATLLSLTVLTFLWAWFATGSTRRLPVVGRLVGGLAPLPPAGAVGAASRPPGARALVGFVFLGLMMTHPLTPVAVIGAVAAAVVVGWIRDRALLALLAAIAVGWLVRCTSYFAAQDFDLGFGGSPGDNAAGNLDYSAAPSAVVLVGTLTRAFSMGIWICALLGALYCTWARRRPGALLLVAAIPFGIPFVQSYGGEAIYRVYLYSLPLMVGLLATAVVSWSPRRLGDPVAAQRTLTVALALAMMPGFVIAHYGREETNQVAPSEVAMEEWIAANLPKPALIAQFGDNYPANATAAYPQLQVSDTYTPMVSKLLGPRRVLPPPSELDDVADDLVALTPGRVYVVVAPGMVRSIAANADLPLATTAEAVAFLTANPRFTVIHRIDDTWLLEVSP